MLMMSVGDHLSRMFDNPWCDVCYLFLLHHRDRGTICNLGSPPLPKSMYGRSVKCQCFVQVYSNTHSHWTFDYTSIILSCHTLTAHLHKHLFVSAMLKHLHSFLRFPNILSFFVIVCTAISHILLIFCLPITRPACSKYLWLRTVQHLGLLAMN